MMIEKLHTIFMNECTGKVSTDTRKLEKGSLFFALRGENFNGNEYAQEALDKGASFAVVDDPTLSDREGMIYVEDVLETLQTLAHFHRKQYDIPVLAITGSNGKTTTKELIASVIGQEKNIVYTEGNYNNHIGVPLTLLRINTETEFVLVEMGANHIGEIAQLCEIAVPNYGLITNIGRAHLGFFGGFDGVIRAKTELYRFLEQHQGASFMNGADTLLLEQSNTLEKITYFSEDSQYPVISQHTQPFVSLRWAHRNINSHLVGGYNCINIAAAIAVGDFFGISPEMIQKGIEDYVPQNSRSEMIYTEKGNIIIKDYYNANRDSMERAIENIAHMNAEQKLLILGDMFELGDYSEEEHRAVVDFVQELLSDADIIFVGNEFLKVVPREDDALRVFSSTKEAIFALQKSPPQNSLVLLKASNGMNFQKLFDEVDW